MLLTSRYAGIALITSILAGCAGSASIRVAPDNESMQDAGASATEAGSVLPPAQPDGSTPPGDTGGTQPTALPRPRGICPAMSNLSGSAALFAEQEATVWSGDPSVGPGLLVLYYYATGSNAREPLVTLGQEQIKAIVAKGGIVVAQNKTTGKGQTTGNDVWYTGDAEIADEITACAIQNQRIDPRRVHVAGYSAGGIQTTYMWAARSGYVASVLAYSGGDVGINVAPLQDAAHPPAALVAHGAKGRDTYQSIVDFFDTSAKWVSTIKAAKGFAIDCNDGGNHTNAALRTKIAPQALQFFLDHPYGVQPEPYVALPATFPSYCTIP